MPVVDHVVSENGGNQKNMAHVRNHGIKPFVDPQNHDTPPFVDPQKHEIPPFDNHDIPPFVDPHNHDIPPFVDPLPPGPYFDMTRSGNVTVLVGRTAHLNCRVNQLGNRTVS